MWGFLHRRVALRLSGLHAVAHLLVRFPLPFGRELG